MIDRCAGRSGGKVLRAVVLPGLACCAALAAGPANAADAPAGPELLPAEGAVRRPTDPIRIRVPGLDDAARERLALELDALDVTDVVLFDEQGEQLSLEPFEPLAWGEHELRLVERTEGDELVERGRWTLEVRHSARLREADASAEAELSGFRRVAEGGPADPGPRSGSEGGATTEGTIADGVWRLSARADFVHHSDASLLPRGRGRVDLGDFLLRGEVGAWWLALGHQAPAPDSLIAAGLRRRGVAAGWGGQDDRASVSAFALRTQDVAGFQGGPAAGDPDDRVEGVALRARPLAGSPDALVVSATWLGGKDPGQFGEGVGGDTVTHAEGGAASLALDGELFERRLQYGAEYARTRWDADGDGSAEARRDRALAAHVEFAALDGRPVGDEPTSLVFGLQRRRLGTFFRSIADPTGTADRSLWRATGAFSRAGLDIQAGLSRETDNVNRLSLLPRVRSRQGSLAVNLAPAASRDPEAGIPWYGEPSLSLNWIGLDQDVVREAAGLLAGDLRDTDALSVSASFSYPAWSWTVSHATGRVREHADGGGGTDDATTELAFNLSGGDGPSLGLSAQRSRSRDRGTGVVFTTETASIDAGYAWTGGLQAGVGASWNRERSSDGFSSLRTLDATGVLRWMLRQAGGGWPAMTVSLEAQRHRRRDGVEPANDAVIHRVYLRLALSWSSGR